MMDWIHLEMLSRFQCWTIWPPLAALGWTAIAVLSGPVSWIISGILLAATDFGIYLLAGYFIWMCYDNRSCINNERRWKWLRNLAWWKNHRDYFPIRLVKTCDLPPDRNYLFAVSPHGIFSFGAMTSFTTGALDFEKKFPGLKLSFCTLNVVFKLPFLRELALGQGFTSVSEESLNGIFTAGEKGRAAAVVVGGASEAALSKPNEYKILLNKRKGFCKVALKNGCSLVPVYAFGESDLYYLHEAKKGSLMEKFQTLFKRLTTIFPVLFYGIGPLFLFPRRVPITVTVGKAIPVDRIEEVTEEDVNKLHGKFKREIVKLFNENKMKYLKYKESELLVC